MPLTYVIHPGKIRRKTGQLEHFDPQELAALYKVDLSKCLIYNPLRKYTDSSDIRYVHLRPRDDEDYRLPK